MILYNPIVIPVLGNRWDLVITIYDSLGKKKDLSGATITVGIGSAPTTLLLSKAADLADQGVSPGQATVSFIPNETRNLPSVVYYQVDAHYAPDNIDTVAKGSIRTQPSMLG